MAVGELQKAAKEPGDASAEDTLTGSLGLSSLPSPRPTRTSLKANQNMMQLSEELRSTENKVAFSQQAFNDALTHYNTYKRTFPPVIFADLFCHSQDAMLLEFEGVTIAKPQKVTF